MKVLCQVHKLPASPVSLILILNFIHLYLVASCSFLTVKKISRKKWLNYSFKNFYLLEFNEYVRKSKTTKIKSIYL